ncbi:hypothetical protein Tco_1493133 [Tanacetum coccineum]
MGIAEDVVVRVDGFTFLADFVVVNFEPDPRVPIILGRPLLRTAKALHDFGSTTTHSDDPSPSSSPVKTSDNFEKFEDELALLDSLPPGNDDSTLKKDLHEENFQENTNVSDEPVLLNTPLVPIKRSISDREQNWKRQRALTNETSITLLQGGNVSSNSVIESLYPYLLFPLKYSDPHKNRIDSFPLVPEIYFRAMEVEMLILKMK